MAGESQKKNAALTLCRTGLLCAKKVRKGHLRAEPYQTAIKKAEKCILIALHSQTAISHAAR